MVRLLHLFPCKPWPPKNATHVNGVRGRTIEIGAEVKIKTNSDLLVLTQ